MKAPEVGTILYQFGHAAIPVGARIVTTWVYCGQLNYTKQLMHLVVEYNKWWSLQNQGKTPTELDGPKYRNLEDLLSTMVGFDKLKEAIAQDR